MKASSPESFRLRKKSVKIHSVMRTDSNLLSMSQTAVTLMRVVVCVASGCFDCCLMLLLIVMPLR